MATQKDWSIPSIFLYQGFIQDFTLGMGEGGGSGYILLYIVAKIFFLGGGFPRASH